VGATYLDGIEARARVGYGLAPNLAAVAEAYAAHWRGADTDVGAIAGLTGRW
jgi:hypothetical protein